MIHDRIPMRAAALGIITCSLTAVFVTSLSAAASPRVVLGELFDAEH
jgi:hypothetical protein